MRMCTPIIRQEQGQALTELILVIPLIVVLIFGVMDLGRMINTYLIILDASREGAKFATQAVDPVQPLNPQITAISTQARQRVLGSIYAATGGEDLNGNSVFDRSDDLNADGNPNEGDVNGSGAWESGGELDLDHNGVLSPPPSGDFRAINTTDMGVGGPFRISFTPGDFTPGLDSLGLRRGITVTVEYNFRLEYLGPAMAFFMRPISDFFPPAWLNPPNTVTVPLSASTTMKGL